MLPHGTPQHHDPMTSLNRAEPRCDDDEAESENDEAGSGDDKGESEGDDDSESEDSNASSKDFYWDSHNQVRKHLLSRSYLIMLDHLSSRLYWAPTEERQSSGRGRFRGGGHPSQAHDQWQS